MHTTRVLADLIDDMRGKPLPDEAREAASRCVLDLITAVAAGFTVPSVAGTRQVAEALYGVGPSPVWFAGKTLTPMGAVFCNSAAASALDLDDGNRKARGHPGAAVIPTAFSIAQETDASTDDLLAAIVAGYEVGVRVGAARGFHARSGLWCGYGAVATAAWLRHTPPDTVSNALAITGMTAPNLLATNGGPRYPVPVGNDIKEGIPWATVTGLTALHLAEAGLAGPEDILDHAPHHDSDAIAAGFGGRPAICDTYFKPFACCRHIHAPVEAAETLMARHAIAPGDITGIDVHTYEGALRISNRPRPRNLVDVQFSIPYCIGLTVTLGNQVLIPPETGVLGRPDVTALAEKVALHLDAALDARFPAESLTRVVITTKENRFESAITAPSGEASDPLSWGDLQEKFRTATGTSMADHHQERLLQAIDRFRGGERESLTEALARQEDFG